MCPFEILIVIHYSVNSFFIHFFDVKRVDVSIVPVLLKWSQLKMCFVVTLQRMRVSTRKRTTFGRRWKKKMFVVGVLVVGGCYRRVPQSPFAHINVHMLPVASLVLRLLSNWPISSIPALAYSGEINKHTLRMLALPTLIALSFVAFFASAGT